VVVARTGSDEAIRIISVRKGTRNEESRSREARPSAGPPETAVNHSDRARRARMVPQAGSGLSDSHQHSAAGLPAGAPETAGMTSQTGGGLVAMAHRPEAVRRPAPAPRTVDRKLSTVDFFIVSASFGTVGTDETSEKIYFTSRTSKLKLKW
jgi:hypothetical protein